jgi:hypothetical protein
LFIQRKKEIAAARMRSWSKQKNIPGPEGFLIVFVSGNVLPWKPAFAGLADLNA